MRKSSKPITVPIALFVASVLAAGGEIPVEPGFPAGIRLAAKTRGEAAIAALGARLPEVAAFHDKSPQQLRDIFRADHTLWVDPAGQLIYACEFECAECAHDTPEADGEIAELGPTDPAPYDTSQAFLLHSRPGANRVIYLDFDGHVDNTSGNWVDGASAPPYNVSGDPAVFSTDERNRIIEIWQRVAEDFSMYEIDVTTEDPGVPALSKSNSSDAAYGIRVCIGGSGNDWYGNNVGGVAYVGSFDSSQDVPCWVFTAGTGNAAKGIAEATSHEVGHTLGLLHDGRVVPNEGYYEGHGNWAPIMGVGYYEPITQWSKGEYASANNTQDDMAVMLTQGAVYRADDHGNSTANATVLSSENNSVSIGGVIERNTDLDFFRIEAPGGSGSLAVNIIRAPSGSNLRLEVKLYDLNGVLLQTATAADTTGGTQSVTLTRTVSAGFHYVSVNGIGIDDPLTTGYTDYGSLGQYTGTITGVLPDGFSWVSTAGGTMQWNTASNWVAGNLPTGVAPTVRINNNIAGNQTIQLASAIPIRRLYLGDSNNTHSFTFASSGGSLAFGSEAQLSKTAGANDVITAPVSLSSGLTLTQSASGTLGFSGGISGSGVLTKDGAGTVVFSTANTYTGATKLADGLLRLDNVNGLPGGIDNAVGAGESALSFKGGVLGLNGDFTRQIGAGAGQLNWDPGLGGAGSGGFAAFGADRQVRLNNGTSALTWSTGIIGSGNILILSHPTATHTLDFKNGIGVAGSSRVVRVDDGAADVDAILSGVLNGAGGFTKAGTGTLSLANANSYTGITTVADGLLRLQNAAALPSGNLELTAGGVLGLGAADLTARTIGIGTNQVRWLDSGGFAAFGANRAVKFSVSSINWDATNFIGTGRVLILSHDTADATLDWQQRISLAGSPRIIQDGSAAIDAKMSGIITGGTSGTSNTFSKAGPGTLAFTAQNDYWGDTIIGAGTLMIGDGGTVGGVSQNTSKIIVETGATLATNHSDTLTQGTNPFKVAITGDGGFTQAGTGNTVLTLANTYIGPTTLNAGTLTLGAAGVLPNASEVSIGNATLAAGSFSESTGRLVITGAATINLGTGAALSFASSSTVAWSGGTLALTGNFVSGSSLRFGTNGSGLTPSQLALIKINGNATHLALDNLGYLISGYPAWKTANAPITGTNPNSDEDGDGVTNGVEFVLGGLIGTKDDGKLPEISIGGNMLFTFKRDQKSIGGTTALSIDTSPDLLDWTTGYAVPDSAATANPGVTVIKGTPTGFDTVTLTLPMSDLKKFARIKVTP